MGFSICWKISYDHINRFCQIMTYEETTSVMAYLDGIHSNAIQGIQHGVRNSTIILWYIPFPSLFMRNQFGDLYQCDNCEVIYQDIIETDNWFTFNSNNSFCPIHIFIYLWVNIMGNQLASLGQNQYMGLLCLNKQLKPLDWEVTFII